MTSPVFGSYAEVYDEFYDDKDYAAELQYVVASAGLAPETAGRLLEIGCGSGRFTELLLSRGFDVTGVDVSSAMIERAARRLSTLATLGARPVVLRVADARVLSDLGAFDAAISLFHVVNYLDTRDDLRACLASVARLLPTGGRMVFDSWHGPGVLADPPAPRVKERAKGATTLRRVATPTHDPATQRVAIRYDVTMSGPEGVRSFSETHTMRYLFVEDVERAADDLFDVERVHGWLTSVPPTAATWSALYVLRRH